MSLLPEGASFQELVQDCFLTYRGCGLAVSALDADLVREWADQAVPFEIVARGIRRGAEKALWDAKPGEPSLHSLLRCRRQVNEEISKYLKLAAGRSSNTLENPKSPSRRANGTGKLRSALRKVGRVRPSLEACVRRLLEGPLLRPGSSLDGVAQESLSLQLLRALSFEERIALVREARGLVSPGFAASEEARRRGRRFVLGAVIRRTLQLPSFW